MYVIGLSGVMSSGKSTVAELLRSLAQEAGYSVADIEFADPMIEVANHWRKSWPARPKRYLDRGPVNLANELIVALPPLIASMTGVVIASDDLLIDKCSAQSLQLHQPLLQYLQYGPAPTTLTRANKAEHRQLLTWLGSVLRAVGGDDLWSHPITERLQSAHECHTHLATVGGLRYEADRDAVYRWLNAWIVRVIQPGATHQDIVTELAPQRWQSDVMLFNDGNLPELRLAVAKLWHDITAGNLRLQPPEPVKYRASVLALS